MDKYGKSPWNVLWCPLATASSAHSSLRRVSPGAQLFLPVRPERSYVRRYRKVVTRNVPLIPGCAFVRSREPLDFRSTPIPGVRGYVRDGSRKPIEVPHEEVVALSQLTFGLEEEEQTVLSRGDNVEFINKHSPFWGLSAVVKRLNQFGADLEIQSGGKSLRVTVALDKIRAA